MNQFNNNFYGVDVAIENTTNIPIAYEINGIQSGMKGFMRLGSYENLLDEIVTRIIESASGKPIILMKKSNIHFRYKNLKQRLEDNGIKTVTWKKNAFLLENYKIVQGEDYGIIFGAGLDFPVHGKNPKRITNPGWLECLLAAKILQQVFLTKTSIAENIPAATFISKNQTSLDEFLSSMKDKGTDKFVYKPNFGAQGNGVRVISGDDARKTRENISSKSWKGLFKQFEYIFYASVDNSLYGENYRTSEGMFQEFRQSKPILSSETGKYHSACARVIHFNGSIDAYWRLSPNSVDDHTATPEDKHIVNLSRDSLVEPMNDADKEILFPFVDTLIQEYETQLKPFLFKHPAQFARFKEKIYVTLFQGEKIEDLTQFYDSTYKDLIPFISQEPLGVI